MRRSAFLLALLLLAATNRLASAEVQLNADPMIGVPDSEQTFFGYRVSVDGDVAAVSSFDVVGNGMVYVYRRLGSAGWTLEQRLPGGSGESFFGFQIALSGDTLVAATPTGHAFVYDRTDAGWARGATLAEPDADVLHLQSVALDGDSALLGRTAALGEPFVTPFTRSDGSWQAQDDISAPVGAANFARVIDLDGDTAVVGARGESIGTGAAYVYTTTGSGWTLQQRLAASDAAQASSFGVAVAVLGDTVVVGAHDQPNAGPGAAYVFERGGSVWTQARQVTRQSSIDFGRGVALAPGWLLVGDPEAGGGAGAVYAYPRAESNDGMVLPAAGLSSAAGLGFAVAASPHVALGGAQLQEATGGGSGAVYPFSLNVTPVVSDDVAATPQYQPVAVDVLANDSDADADELVVHHVSAPAHGTTQVDGAGTITYSPDATFKGTDSFDYTVADGAGGFASGTVTVDEIACGEVGLRALDGTPLEGAVSETIDRQVEPLVAGVAVPLASALHSVNCAAVVPVETVVNGSG